MSVIRVSMLVGRSKEQKAKIAAAITQAMVEHAGSTPAHINVIFDEKPRDGWALGGKLLAD